jgi:hypothetical protein
MSAERSTIEDDLIECLIGKIDTDEVTAGGEDWLATETADPFEFEMQQWQENDHEMPTGRRIRVRLRVDITEVSTD